MGTFLMMTLLHFYSGTISPNPLLSLPVVIIEFLFCFCCGALAKRHEVIERFRHFLHRRGIANGGLLLALCALVLIRILIPHASWEGLFALAVVLLLAVLRYRPWIKAVLVFLGVHSMNIWMIHTWLCRYLFHDFFYSFKYPILIFAATLGVSIVVSLMVDAAFRLIERPRRAAA